LAAFEQAAFRRTMLVVLGNQGRRTSMVHMADFFHLDIMEIILAEAVSALSQWLERYSLNEYFVLWSLAFWSLQRAATWRSMTLTFGKSVAEILTVAGAIYDRRRARRSSNGHPKNSRPSPSGWKQLAPRTPKMPYDH